MTREEAMRTARGIIQTQNLGVLATAGEEYPYTSLVGFFAEDDLRTIVFATSRDTTKYQNLAVNGKVSFLITNSANREADFSEAAVVTALGFAKDVSPDKERNYKERYLLKFPFLNKFVNDESTAIIGLQVEKYVIVNRFQDVNEVVP